MRKPIAVITGATSGIGEAYAELLAKKGYHIYLIGRNKAKGNDMKKFLCQQYPCEVEFLAFDLGSQDDQSDFLFFLNNLEYLDLFINNAGFGWNKPFDQENLKKREEMLQVHVMTVVKTSHLVLKKMLKQKFGSLINVLSLVSFLPTADPMYLSTKAFIKSFTQDLAYTYKGTGIKIQALCPGYVTTNIFDRANATIPPFVKTMTPYEVASISLKDLDRGSIICIPGWFNRILYFFIWFCPDWIIAFFMRKILKGIV